LQAPSNPVKNKNKPIIISLLDWFVSQHALQEPVPVPDESPKTERPANCCKVEDDHVHEVISKQEPKQKKAIRKPKNVLPPLPQKISSIQVCVQYS
jgi:hypothetical protein